MQIDIARDKYEKLFATPLLRFRVPDADDLNRDLVELGQRMRRESPGASKSNKGGWHSEGNLFDVDAAPVSVLRDAVHQSLAEANDAIGSKADATKLRLRLFGWMNMNPKDGFNAPHTHPGAHWSGVYYVAQPAIEVGNSGMIEFIDSRSDLPNWRILEAPPFRLKKKMRPKPGELILFPSYLVHWVYPNEADEDRITIAFNATYKRRRK